MRQILLTIPLLLLCSLACTSGDSGKVRPPGESFAVAAPAPDTAPSAPPPQVAPAVKKLSRPAQRAWDTAAPESFDVQELNRKRAEPESQKIDTMRVKPPEYPGLPANIAAWLEERGYTIPQISWVFPEEYANAIKGSFFRKGQIDWAVLVSRSGLMSLLVFPDCSVGATQILFDKVDENWYTYVANPEVAVYLYEITKLTIRELEQIKIDHPDLIISPILNEGIHFYVIEKASSIYYYQDSVWLRVPFMD